MVPVPDPSDRRLEVDSISKRYGEKLAVQDLSLQVDPGRIFGFVGPNGAGKTTAMRIIVGLLQPDGGTVRWGGSPIDAEHRRRIGYMPEERGLYPKMRIADQLDYFGELHGLGAEVASRRTAEWLERLGLSDRAGDNVETLSLGNQQRVQLAASLVYEPDLLILDEPFSGLDPIGVDVLSEVLKEVCEERQVPVIFSSHQLDLVERLCDSVVIIREGRLVASGDVAELERSHSGNIWTVRVEGRDPGWDPELEGATALGGGRFELDPGTDSEALLDRARAAGRVTEFSRHRASLSQLFRESMAESGGDAS